MGEGPINTCKIAFIGEAPGSMEERFGRPFIGPAGQHLTKIMHLAGVAREEVYITNVVKEHPPNDDISIFFKPISNGHVWKSEAYEHYLNLLREELNTCSANVLVPLGNAALYALTGLVSITKRRGSILPSTGLDTTRKVIPTIHPSAALRQYIFTHFIRMDLKRAKEESEFPEIILPERTLLIQPTYLDIISYLNSLKSERAVAFDIEVVNEEMSCISLAASSSLCMSIPFHSSRGEYMTQEQEAEVMLRIAEILENPSITKIGQNAIFDAAFLLRKYGIKTKNIQDTMIATGILTPDFPKGLDFITSIYTKEPYYKDEGKKWFKIGGSDEQFWLYNAKDSAVCMEAFPLLYKELSKQGNLDTYQCQAALIEPLMYMQHHGMRVDHGQLEYDENGNVVGGTGLAYARWDANRRIESLTAELHNLCKTELNPNSPKQLALYFYGIKKIPPYYKNGRVTTDIDALKRLSRRGVQEATILIELRKWRKLLSTYFEMKFSSDGRLRSAMNPIGTTTGRLSSSKDIFGEGGNVQNLPPIFKKFILADEGYVAYDVDLSGADNRVVAYIAPEPLMRSAFENNEDLHRLTASLIFGIPKEEISDEPGSSQLGGGMYSQRFWGKKANHSLNYGLGYKSFALRFELPEPEAKFIVDRYHSAYPGVRQYHAWVQAALSKGRTLENCFGRKRLFLDRWGDQLFKEAYSFIPQSTVADKINRQGILFLYYNQASFHGVELLNQVHDSIVFQIPISLGWDYHAFVITQLLESLETPVPWHGSSFKIPAEVKMGLNLKDMEKVDATPTGLAERLHGIYEKVRTQRAVPIVDSDFDDSGSFTEEDELSMGA